MDGIFETGFSVVKDMFNIFSSPPFVYFVGVALVGSIAGVALKFVPIKRR